MQTILGANGPIGDELARELYRNFTRDIRLVSRNPHQVHDSDQLVRADLMDKDATAAAVEGTEVAYLTVGLPMDSQLWEDRFPTMMTNVIAACEKHGTKLVFFDNTYMYPGTPEPQTEETAFRPGGRKGAVRARIAAELLSEIHGGRIDAVICRAPEFYGPGSTKSLTNTMVFDRLAAGKKAVIPISAHTRRTLIWTPDASRAMALVGNTPDAYGQTWHLPCDPSRPTYRDIIDLASEASGKKLGYVTIPKFAFRIGGLFNAQAKEVTELLPRYEGDNIFEFSKFTGRFPDFRATSFREGISTILG